MTWPEPPSWWEEKCLKAGRDGFTEPVGHRVQADSVALMGGGRGRKVALLRMTVNHPSCQIIQNYLLQVS